MRVFTAENRDLSVIFTKNPHAFESALVDPHIIDEGQKDGYDLEDEREFGSRQVENLICALSVSPAKLTTLEIHSFNWNDPKSPHLRDQFLDLSNFMNLQRLQISTINDECCVSSDRFRDLGRFISQLVQLLDLGLVYHKHFPNGPDEYGYINSIDFSQIMSQATLPHLCRLNLQGVLFMSEDSILDIISRHRKSLKFLRMSRVWICDDGSWMQAFLVFKKW